MAIRWGIIGCGSVCEVKSGPPLREIPGSEVSVVMRRDAAKARDYAQRHGIARWTSDVDSVLSDPNIDAIYVATPPGSHAEYALAAAWAGKPCYVEKPLARQHRECQRMVTGFREAGLPLFVAYYRRALPRFRQVQALLHEGRLGDLLSVQVRYASNRSPDPGDWRLDAAQSGGGLLLDLGSHTLDILDFLCGPLNEIAGQASRHAEGPGVEDTVVACGRFESGALFSGTWDFAGTQYHDEIRFVGSRAVLTLSTFGDGPLELQTTEGVEHFEFKNPSGIQTDLITTIVDELQGNGGVCPSTGASAARTNHAMDVILQEYYGGRNDEFWRRMPGANAAI